MLICKTTKYTWEILVLIFAYVCIYLIVFNNYSFFVNFPLNKRIVWFSAILNLLWSLCSVIHRENNWRWLFLLPSGFWWTKTPERPVWLKCPDGNVEALTVRLPLGSFASDDRQALDNLDAIVKNDPSTCWRFINLLNLIRIFSVFTTA